MTPNAEGAAEAAASPGPAVPWEPAPAADSTAILVPGASGIEYSGTIPRLAAWLVDSVITVIIVFAVGLVAGVAGVALGASTVATTLVAGALAIGIQAAYFIGGWRSAARATPGMRLIKLQIGQVSDGQTLSLGQAGKRWFALTGWAGFATLVPALYGVVSALSLVWVIALLITVANGARHQGLHDRFAGSAIVRPVGASNAAVWVVVILLGVFVVLPFLAIIALIYLGSQISGILSTVGTPG